MYTRSKASKELASRNKASKELARCCVCEWESRLGLNAIEEYLMCLDNDTPISKEMMIRKQKVKKSSLNENVVKKVALEAERAEKKAQKKAWMEGLKAEKKALIEYKRKAQMNAEYNSQTETAVASERHTIKVNKITIDGVMYYRNPVDNSIYDINTKEEVGKYDEVNNVIIYCDDVEIDDISIDDISIDEDDIM